jgi:hypothetical protein
MLGTFVFMMPSILLSGYATPIENMPTWLQPVTALIPLKYMLIISKGLFLKAMPARIVFANIWPMVIIGLVWLVRFTRRGKAMRQPWLRDPLASDPGGPWEVLVWIGIVAAGLIVRTLNPIARSKADTAAQAAAHPAADAGAAAFVAVLLLSAFIAGLGLARRRADNWPRLALIVPPLFFLVFPLAVRFAGPQFDGAAWQFPWCFAIGIFSFCTSLVIYPYWRSLWPWSRRSSA